MTRSVRGSADCSVDGFSSRCLVSYALYKVVSRSGVRVYGPPVLWLQSIPSATPDPSFCITICCNTVVLCNVCACWPCCLSCKTSDSGRTGPASPPSATPRPSWHRDESFWLCKTNAVSPAAAAAAAAARQPAPAICTHDASFRRQIMGGRAVVSVTPASQRLNLPLASFTAARPPMPNGGACKTNRDQHACPGQQSQSNLTTVHVPLMGDLADATYSDASASSSLFVLPLAPSVPGRSPPVLIRLQVVWGTRTHVNHTGANCRVHSLLHPFFFLLFFVVHAGGPRGFAVHVVFRMTLPNAATIGLLTKPTMRIREEKETSSLTRWQLTAWHRRPFCFAGQGRLEGGPRGISRQHITASFPCHVMLRKQSHGRDTESVLEMLPTPCATVMDDTELSR